MCSPNLTWFQPSRLHNYLIQVHHQTHPIKPSSLTRSRPPNESPNSLHYSFHVRTIMAPKCISKLVQLWSQSASLSWLHHTFLVYV
jgi:hypothetical protein